MRLRIWLMKDGNAYWNRNCRQWTCKEKATEYWDSEVDETELTGDATWTADYREGPDVW